LLNLYSLHPVFHWIPAFAGMTEERTGMTERTQE